MRLLMFLSFFITLPVLATPRTLSCIQFFEDGSSEQGGGNYYLKVQNQSFELWHSPYQEQDDGTGPRPDTFETKLKKVKTTTTHIKLFAKKIGITKFEYASIGEMGVLDVRRGEWSRTYKCE